MTKNKPLVQLKKKSKRRKSKENENQAPSIEIKQDKNQRRKPISMPVQ